MTKAREKIILKGFAILIIPLILALFILAGFVTYKFLAINSEDAPVTIRVVNSVVEKIIPPSPTSTPLPFKEMTIPELRSREYVSKLGKLEKLSENSNFTSYLTNYDSDGLKINGYLTIPKGKEPKAGWPAVVFVHGYVPPQEYKTTDNYVSYADALANDSLVVFKIDLRGHGNSEGEVSGAYFSENYIVDTLNAYSALENADFINTEKIGLWGHSMAGNVVFRSKVVKPEISKVVIWAGAVYTYEDFSDYRISDNSYQPPPQQSESRKRREELFETHGNFDPENEFWKQVAPTNYLAEVRGEIQIHHAVNDNVVSIEYSRNLDKVLDDSKIGHKLYEYASGGHNITDPSFTLAMQRSADFLKK